MEMRTATIHFRIQPQLKKQAEVIFAESGHSTSDVLQQFYLQTVKRGKVPIRLAQRARILDESVNTPEELLMAVEAAEESARKQIEGGNYITFKEVRERMKKKYDVEL